MKKRISGWGRNIASDANISFPKNLKELKKEIKKNCIARGLGRSYGDSSIQPNKTLVTTKLNNIINFNHKKGILESECGVSIKQLNEIVCIQYKKYSITRVYVFWTTVFFVKKTLAWTS